MPILRRRSWTYPLSGLVLALGAPSGLFVTRAFAQRAVPTFDWIGNELGAEWLTYVYVAISTSVVMMILGWLLGRSSDRLETGALTDPLTGLWNRRRILARTLEEVARAERYGIPLSLVMIDVDGLKKINDVNGHRAGDEAIARVAAAIRSNARRTDLASRHGGDELAILAPEASAADAKRLSERIRATLAASDDEPRVTLSIGVADLDDAPGYDPAELWEMADRALYRAKASGRDRVVLASELTERRKGGRSSHIRHRMTEASTSAGLLPLARRTRR